MPETTAATLSRTGEREDTVLAYACFWVLQMEPGWRLLERGRRRQALDEARGVLEKVGDVGLRGAYALAGLRHDADLMMWWVGKDAEVMQEVALALAPTDFRAHLRFRELYLGLSRGSLYTPDHLPSFVKQEPARDYAIVYPFIKTPEWYLLAFERRRELMAEHGLIGRRFEVGTNTVQAFGLGDQEFIVALEADDPAELVRCLEALRGAEVRRYTQVDTPIYLGRRMTLAAALETLA